METSLHLRGVCGGAGPSLRSRAALRLARAYGTRVERILGAARSMADLGRDFGCGLTEAELDYLARDEWARTADDVLWRRSKLGLHLSKSQAEAVAMYYASSSGDGTRPRNRITDNYLYSCLCRFCQTNAN